MSGTTEHEAFAHQQGIDPYSCTGSSPTGRGEGTSRLPDSIRGDVAVDDPSISPRGRVSFEWIGARRLGVIPVLGGISADSHVTGTIRNPIRGWWQDFVGPGKPLDTDSTAVLGIDYLGAPGTIPDSDKGLDTITTADQARVLGQVLDKLGVDTIPAIIGSSYGGMVALAFAALFPDRVARILVIGAAHRSHPMATALRDIQRSILELGAGSGREKDCVALARALAMTTYRSSREFEDRFGLVSGEHVGSQGFPVTRYLESRGRKFAQDFDAQAFSRLSRSIDLHQVDPADITVPVDIVSIDSDAVVPPWLVEELVSLCRGPARLHKITSRYGHDAFLKEKVALGRIVRSFAEDLAANGRHGAGEGTAATGAVRAGVTADPVFRAVMPPIYLSANYGFEQMGRCGAYDYSRTANPTRDLLAGTIADLERGEAACVTSSGMSAVLAVLQLLKPGATLVAPHDCYGGTRRLFDSLAKSRDIQVTYHDMSDAARLTAAAGARPQMMWIETPSNPLLRITDLALAGRLTRDTDTILVVDNTFMSPVLQNPILFGADIVVHSTTKFLNGHSDVVGGVVVARDKSVGEEIAWWCNCLGVTGAPFDSFLTLRGVRTLHARIAVHQENAAQVVSCLSEHPEVRALHYPGLPDHAGHEIARRQQRGFGSLISLELDRDRHDVAAFVESLRHFTLAESLGGVESLVCHPATMTHASMDQAARTEAGISDSLVRLSVGIEDPADLVADLVSALDGLGGGSERR